MESFTPNKSTLSAEGSTQSFEKPHAEIQEITLRDEDETGELLTYCHQYPDAYNLQIRSRNPLKGRHASGKQRNLIATVSVTIEEIEEMLAFMKRDRTK